jgi:hypothetical protein
LALTLAVPDSGKPVASKHGRIQRKTLLCRSRKNLNRMAITSRCYASTLPTDLIIRDIFSYFAQIVRLEQLSGKSHFVLGI